MEFEDKVPNTTYNCGIGKNEAEVFPLSSPQLVKRPVKIKNKYSMMAFNQKKHAYFGLVVKKIWL